MQNDLDWDKIKRMIRNAYGDDYKREKAILGYIEQADATKDGRVYVLDDDIHVYTPEAGVRTLLKFPEVVEVKQRIRTVDEAIDKGDDKIRAKEVHPYNGAAFLNREPETLEELLQKVEEEVSSVPQQPLEKWMDQSCSENEEMQQARIALHVQYDQLPNIRELFMDGECERAAVEMYRLGEGMQRLRFLPFERAAATSAVIKKPGAKKRASRERNVKKWGKLYSEKKAKYMAEPRSLPKRKAAERAREDVEAAMRDQDTIPPDPKTLRDWGKGWEEQER